MNNTVEIYKRIVKLEGRVSELEERTTPLSMRRAAAQVQHAIDNTDPLPTPPSHWDEWAMEKAQAVQRRVFKDIGLDNKQINAIHSALIEAMRFAAQPRKPLALVEIRDDFGVNLKVLVDGLKIGPGQQYHLFPKDQA